MGEAGEPGPEPIHDMLHLPGRGHAFHLDAPALLFGRALLLGDRVLVRGSPSLGRLQREGIVLEHQDRRRHGGDLFGPVLVVDLDIQIPR
jgi:hypothetical protein